MKIPNLGYLPLQDHNPEATDGFRGILYAVRTLGFDAENRPLPEPGTAGDLCGPVVFKPVGEDRGACAAWAFAMPVVGQQSSGLEIEASTGAAITGGGSGRISTLTPAMGPDSEGNLQPALGLEHLSYARDGRADHVYNLAGDKKLAPGAGGILVSSLDPGKQLPLLLDASPLIAVNQAGDPDCGTPVYDLKDPDGAIDHTRFARLQSFWRVKQVIQPNKSTFTGITPGDKATFKNGALAWQLSSGGPSHLHGGGLVYDDAAIDETPPPSTDQTRVRETTKLGDPNNEGALTQLGPGQTRVRQPSLASDQAARAGGTARPVFYWQTVDVPGTIQDQTVLRKPNPSAALAMMSARRGGPVDVGGNGCQHQIGETTDGERVNAAHLSTRTLMRSPLGREGPLDYTDDPYTKPPASLFKTRAHIKFDAEAGHDWVLGTGLGRYRLEAESLFTPPPPIGDPPPRKPKDEDPPKPPPGVRQPPDIDSLLPWIIGDDFGRAVAGRPAKPRPGNVLRSVMSPVSSTGALVGPEGPKGGGQSPTQRNQTSGGTTGRPLPPVASDFSVDRAGDAMVGGRLYVPGICFVAPEQRAGNRIATGDETLARPETGGMLMHGGSGVAGPTLVADPCKKNRPVSKGGVAFVGPCYSLTDLYNGTATKTGQEFQLTLPPGATQIAQGTPTTTGGIKNGFVESVVTGGASTTKVHKNSTGTSGAGTKQTSGGKFSTIDSSGNDKTALTAAGGVSMTEQSAPSTPAAGYMEWYPKSDGKPYVKNDAGTETDLTATGGGGGIAAGNPMSYYPSNAYYSYYTSGSESIRDIAWGPWGGSRLTGNFSYNWGVSTAVDLIADPSRTFTFAAGTNDGVLGYTGATLTASSGSFITDGWQVGMMVRSSGTSSNNFDALITAVTATVLTYRPLYGSTGATEGPLSATARIKPTWNYHGRDYISSFQRDCFVSGMNFEDGSIEILWDTPVVLPPAFTSFNEGISIDTYVKARSGSWSADSIDLELYVYDPATGATEIANTRTVTADDSDYVTLTIAPADLTDFVAGHQLRVGFRTTNVSYVAVGNLEVRVSNLRAY